MKLEKHQEKIDVFQTLYYFVFWCLFFAVGLSVAINFAVYIQTLEEPLKLFAVGMLLYFVVNYARFLGYPDIVVKQ